MARGLIACCACCARQRPVPLQPTRMPACTWIILNPLPSLLLPGPIPPPRPLQACISAAKSEVLNEVVKCSPACLLKPWQFGRLIWQVWRPRRGLRRNVPSHPRRGCTAGAACAQSRAAHATAGGTRQAKGHMPWCVRCRSSPAATCLAGPAATRWSGQLLTHTRQSATARRSSPASRRPARASQVTAGSAAAARLCWPACPSQQALQHMRHRAEVPVLTVSGPGHPAGLPLPTPAPSPAVEPPLLAPAPEPEVLPPAPAPEPTLAPEPAVEPPMPAEAPAPEPAAAPPLVAPAPGKQAASCL